MPSLLPHPRIEAERLRPANRELWELSVDRVQCKVALVRNDDGGYGEDCRPGCVEPPLANHCELRRRRKRSPIGMQRLHLDRLDSDVVAMSSAPNTETASAATRAIRYRRSDSTGSSFRVCRRRAIVRIGM